VNLAIRAANGETIEARTEEWLAALLLELPAEARGRVFERVRKKMVAYATPGSHVLQVASSRGLMPLQAFEADSAEKG